MPIARGSTDKRIGAKKKKREKRNTEETSLPLNPAGCVGGELDAVSQRTRGWSMGAGVNKKKKRPLKGETKPIDAVLLDEGKRKIPLKKSGDHGETIQTAASKKKATCGGGGMEGGEACVEGGGGGARKKRANRRRSAAELYAHRRERKKKSNPLITLSHRALLSFRRWYFR